MPEEEEVPVINPGDLVNVTSGDYKGKSGKVIAAYNNSIAVEVETTLEDGTKPRTVLKHSEYEL
ncbi:DUF2187 domain-containing protein [Salipaludibacillus neizhouensis]|uniref:DUF2187 domain-containing protein n=1 Tax=Salipaludibacillus neizhouensis TaxID=885475 RepID=A0A3A9KMZ7_9BACI|nr:KOW motif domain-containing protein [Salipaludibacillus neizhouensis]RKL69295.1 DUF2187 domain-containing protein [Salipaludibacillus neizhouensis]